MSLRAFVPARLSIGLLGRLLTILLLTVGIEFAVSAWLYQQSSRALVEDDEAHRLAEHLIVARTLVAGQPLPERPAMAERVTTNRYDVRWSGTGAAPPPADDGSLADMRDEVLRWEPGLAGSDLRMKLETVQRRARIFGGLRLPDGSWLRFRAAAPAAVDDLALHRIVLALLPAALLLVLGALLFRHTLRPMGMLARAAGRIGDGRTIMLPEAGPVEVRKVIHAFNAMQARIHRLIGERTQALAAVGHDLRTPLARMKLRADAVDEAPVRTAFEADIGEMEAMVNSLLAYLGGEENPEALVRSDVAVLIATCVDAASDRGGDASYEGPEHLEAAIRPSALRRAVSNLIENAIQYGHVARVTLAEEGETMIVTVSDDGPGIPDDRIASVLQPFVRLDHARGRNTKGLGLGLAIVAKAAALNEGTFALANREGGGLDAVMRLPVR